MRISDWSSDVCSSDLLVILGIAFFIVGGVIVFLLTDDDDGDSASDQARPVSVVVATNEVAAGALADELIEQGGLRVVEIEVGAMVPGAVQSLNQLDGATFVQGFAKDQQLISRTERVCQYV